MILLSPPRSFNKGVYEELQNVTGTPVGFGLVLNQFQTSVTSTVARNLLKTSSVKLIWMFRHWIQMRMKTPKKGHRDCPHVAWAACSLQAGGYKSGDTETLLFSSFLLFVLCPQTTGWRPTYTHLARAHLIQTQVDHATLWVENTSNQTSPTLYTQPIGSPLEKKACLDHRGWVGWAMSHKAKGCWINSW